MNMTLSKRGDYVMRAAISLARAFADNSPRKIREVVADTEVPTTFASQILADLVRAGLAVSKAGREGGYRLSRPPAEISVLEVVEAAEGPLRSERCALGDGPCRWEAVCPLHETWSEATVALRALLSQTSLAEVAERDVAIEAGTYSVPADAHRSHPISIDVADMVQVELGLAAVHAGLARLQPVLSAAAAAAAEESGMPAGDGHRGGGTRENDSPMLEVTLAPAGQPERKARPRPSGQAANYMLGWQIGLPPAASRLEAELSVVPLDAERSELRIEGTWRQLPGKGDPLGRADLERAARATMRAFLRRLARALEDGPVPEHTPRRAAPVTPASARRSTAVARRT